MSWKEIKKSVNSDLNTPLNVQMKNTHDISIAPVVTTTEIKKISSGSYTMIPKWQHNREIWFNSDFYGGSSSLGYFVFGFYDMVDNTIHYCKNVNWYGSSNQLYTSSYFMFATSKYSYCFCNKKDNISESYYACVLKYNKNTGNVETVKVDSNFFVNFADPQYNTYIICNDIVYLIHSGYSNSGYISIGVYKIIENDSGIFNYELITDTLPQRWVNNTRSNKNIPQYQIELDDNIVAFIGGYNPGTSSNDITFGLYLFNTNTSELSIIGYLDGLDYYNRWYCSLIPLYFRNKVCGLIFNKKMYLLKNNTLIESDIKYIVDTVIENLSGSGDRVLWYVENNSLYFCSFANSKNIYYSLQRIYPSYFNISNDCFYYLTKGTGFYTTQNNIKRLFDIGELITEDKTGNYVCRDFEEVNTDEDGYVVIPETGIYYIDTIYGSPRGTFIQKGE